MPVSKPPSDIAARIAAMQRQHDNDYPLWQGPCGAGPNGGVTQSMIGRFLSCRERFRLRYVLGLEPHDKWSHRLGYGNMWHVCEEALAAEVSHFGEWVGTTLWQDNLCAHVKQLQQQYPYQREEIMKWYYVCAVQFPEYVKHWANHPDVQGRTPLMQEQVFDVPYALPSGRTVRLRGKFDSVDLIEAHTDEDGHKWPQGIWLQENKTKGDVDREQIERQLRFDLQTMLYLIALRGWQENKDGWIYGERESVLKCSHPILGVRYNVVRRPLSGGKGTIRPHEATKGTKCTKCKMDPEKQLGCPKCGGRGRVGAKPAETDEEFYERLRAEYIAADPDYYFFRVRAGVGDRDVQVFREACLDPLLETMCCWYDEVTGKDMYPVFSEFGCPMNYRTPFGVYSALEDNGSTEYDAYLETSSEAGLRRTKELFTELK